MKKFLRLSTALLTVAIVFSLFASCGKLTGNSAIKKLEKVFDATDEFYAESIKTEIEASLEFSGKIAKKDLSVSTEIEGS